MGTQRKWHNQASERKKVTDYGRDKGFLLVKRKERIPSSGNSRPRVRKFPYNLPYIQEMEKL